jgi:hypothetical protein
MAGKSNMPATRERVYLCPEQDGQPISVLDFPPWWDRREFFQKYADRQLDTGNPFYVDFGLLLAGWEASAWDERCRLQFTLDPRSQEPYFVEALHRWETLLKAARWVIIESYEWESGLS